MATAGYQTSSEFSVDRKKYIQDRLIQRLEVNLVLSPYGNPVMIPEGSGTTVTFIGYARVDLPMAALTEGVTPEATTMAPTEYTGTVDEWGMYMALTNLSIITTRTPILNEGLNLIGDAQGRCVEYNAHDTLLRGTAVQYHDGSETSRGGIDATDYWTTQVMHRARVTFQNAGASPRNGDRYVAITDPAVMADILNETTTPGGFVAAHINTDSKIANLERGKVGSWAGFDFVQSNFFPTFTRLTHDAPTTSTGGSLSGTVYFKMTRRSKQRGHEETIGVEGNQAMGADTRLVVTTPNESGYVYHFYIGSSTGDANLFRVATNVAPNTAFNVDSVPASGTTPPATPPSDVTIHVMYLLGADCLDYIKLTGNSMTPTITPKAASDADPLEQRRKMGAKWTQKARIRDQSRLLRVELASRFS